MMDDLGIHRTLWERVVDWMIPAPCAAEERALYAQEIRRLKLKTDLQEERIRNRRDREDNYRKVATWRAEYRLTSNAGIHTPVYGMVHMYENKSTNFRKLVWSSVINKDGGSLLRGTMMDTEISFLRNTPEFLQCVEPWLNWQLTLEDAAKGTSEILLPKKRKQP